ncbi:Cytochrome c551 peroxidase [Pontivivens insulae]|uniref:Cytochrome c551 peroxidase n=1 Tax=Pontivivens insulae TaxID=1639689 RepID=A0A2R8A9S1_9RHOB|nr:cytochrome c peroxidase [Pontivivens insulae]SPF28875.1 Cytochrome c551 peroxidase [Pontivivens insulae]
MRRVVSTLILSTGAAFAQEAIDPTDYVPFDEAQAEIGRLLFYDPILSGNRNISCGTCHHHDLAGGDGLPLGIGEGGEGLGADRVASLDTPIEKRVPRNAPALFNLGHTSIELLFHDGRLSVSDLYQNGFNSPAEEWLPLGLDNIVAAQALFPIVSEVEMAGSPEENEIAGRAYERIDYPWPIIAFNVRTIPEYGEMFVAAFEEVDTADDVTIVEVANAIAAFITSEWRSHDSAYDRFLAGDTTALTAQQQSGMELFFGEAGCSDCHKGPLLSDQEFHALALPHFGPGRTRRFDPYSRDLGRMAETDVLEDAYRFRTPQLRNVALTGPYGHNGAYDTIEGIVRHHLSPVESFEAWQPADVALPEVEWLAEIDFVSFQDRRERARLSRAIDIEERSLTDAQVADVVAFLQGLTGDTALTGRLGRPETVPSGLPVEVRND